MMEKMLVQWREELSEELTCDILPFWMAFLGDGVHFAGRIDGRGKAHPEAGKGAVLIARMLWTFSAAYRKSGLRQETELCYRFRSLRIERICPGDG